MNEIAVFKDVMIPMRDGVRLATDIYRPAQHGKLLSGPFPTLLVRTSYNKEAVWLIDETVESFVPYGYALVLQDLRGRQKSEGTGEYFHVVNPTAGIDGYDTIEWLAEREWCNGRIGMMCSSHLALTQIHAALYRPPHLCAIWPDVAPINSYEHQVRWGGAMQFHMFGALFLHAYDAQEIRDNPEAQAALWDEMERLREWVYRTPFEPGNNPLASIPALEKTLFDYYRRGSYDDFWKLEPNDLERYFDRHADIPATFSGGWYDPYAIATTRHFAKMTAQNESQQRLIMGPWNHGGMRAGLSYAADVDFGETAVWGNHGRYNTERRRWFDRWLKGVENDVDDDPPVQLFVMGGGSGRRLPSGKLDHGGKWRNEQAWPLARMRPTPFYLGENGRLATTKPQTNGSRTFTYDPHHPVPTIAGPVTGFFELVSQGEMVGTLDAKYIPMRARMRSIIPDGGADQKEQPELVGTRPPYPRLSERPDVLVFQTEPLAEAVEVTGPIEMKLWVSSTAVDTDITAKLIDVYPPNADYPDGYDLNIADAILRLRYREGFEEEKLLTPNEVVPITITLPPTSNLFNNGHRIRLDISSSNFPRFDLNPNTGEPMGRHTRMVTAENTIYWGEKRPSYILLPVIPVPK